MAEENRIRDESNDKKYFIMTPQLVLALCKDPYEFALWNVVKMIAAEKGECYLSTPDLAEMAMMSTGKASQCRKSLIENGLLLGEVRRDPGYPQPVWHLRVPDLWEENIAWRKEHDSIQSRIEFRRNFRSFHQVKASPGERGTSPDESKASPGERGTSPDETKKNQQEEPNKEEPKEQPTNPVVVQKLTELDIPTETIQRLATAYPAKLILDQIEHYKWARQNGKAESPGWLIKAIEQGWSLPPPVKKALRAQDPRRYVCGIYGDLIHY